MANKRSHVGSPAPDPRELAEATVSIGVAQSGQGYIEPQFMLESQARGGLSR
jgi:hypothetical protein|tara:strand:+ start:1860 stop:2015 length:156 start_codon:yes stop_codon:yes gene_type:complete